MGPFFWDADRIRFFRDATEHSAYHRDLARVLAPYLSAQDRVLDAGCGLGYLSTALLPYCQSVTAVDRDENAVRELSCRTQGLENFTARQADVFALPLPYDVIVCSSFASMEETLRLFTNSDAHTLLSIKRKQTAHRFSIDADAHTRTSVSAEHYLLSHTIPYQSFDCSLRFDQPFRTIEDAACFFRAYRGKADNSIEEKLAELVPIQDGPFRCCLPVVNDLRVFIIDRRNFQK